jgi:3-hydroxybutyryl-CoA dehydrogenase
MFVFYLPAANLLVSLFFAKNRFMQMVVLANDAYKKELLQDTTDNGAEVVWIENINDFSVYGDADAYIDLLFENTPERKSILKHLLPRPVIINSVIYTLAQTDENFIRIGAWPTFLQGAVVEGSCLKGDLKEQAERVLKHFGKTIEWLPDVPGFITPRVVSMIINEAHFALEEGVSTKAEMDTAMKLGTAYPYGPFEWCEKIGLQNIVALLQTLSKTQSRYTPAPLLQKGI